MEYSDLTKQTSGIIIDTVLELIHMLKESFLVQFFTYNLGN